MGRAGNASEQERRLHPSSVVLSSPPLVRVIVRERDFTCADLVTGPVHSVRS